MYIYVYICFVTVYIFQMYMIGDDIDRMSILMSPSNSNTKRRRICASYVPEQEVSGSSRYVKPYQAAAKRMAPSHVGSVARGADAREGVGPDIAHEAGFQLGRGTMEPMEPSKTLLRKTWFRGTSCLETWLWILSGKLALEADCPESNEPKIWLRTCWMLFLVALLKSKKLEG